MIINSGGWRLLSNPGLWENRLLYLRHSYVWVGSGCGCFLKPYPMIRPDSHSSLGHLISTLPRTIPARDYAAGSFYDMMCIPTATMCLHLAPFRFLL